MSARLFDFRCANGHTHEELVPEKWRSVPCDQCDQPANRLIAAPRAQLEGFSGAFPSAADAWEKRRESHMRKEKRNVERHGTYK
jgi:hypothetical protein